MFKVCVFFVTITSSVCPTFSRGLVCQQNYRPSPQKPLPIIWQCGEDYYCTVLQTSPFSNIAIVRHLASFKRKIEKNIIFTKISKHLLFLTTDFIRTQILSQKILCISICKRRHPHRDHLPLIILQCQ